MARMGHCGNVMQPRIIFPVDGFCLAQFQPFSHFFRALPFRFSMMPSHQPFEFSEALLELRLLEHPELQVIRGPGPRRSRG